MTGNNSCLFNHLSPAGFAMTHASDSHITGHEECIADGKPCLSPSADKLQTACSSPAKLQIINHFNWNNSTQRGQHSQPSSPLTSPTNVDLEPSSPWQSSGGFLAHLKQHEECKGKNSEAHNRQEWGMSVSLNCPSMLPLQTPGLSNVFQAPFRQAVPLIDWSMALITKTNISATPLRTPWAPWINLLARNKTCVQEMKWNIHDMFGQKQARL